MRRFESSRPSQQFQVFTGSGILEPCGLGITGVSRFLTLSYHQKYRVTELTVSTPGRPRDAIPIEKRARAATLDDPE